MTDILPVPVSKISSRHPRIWRAYEQLGKACAEAGPLDDRTKRIVKLALAIANRSEGAVHSHARRGLAEGLLRDELRHVALLAIPTLGFAKAMAGMTWIDDVLESESGSE